MQIYLQLGTALPHQRTNSSKLLHLRDTRQLSHFSVSRFKKCICFTARSCAFWALRSDPCIQYLGGVRFPAEGSPLMELSASRLLLLAPLLGIRCLAPRVPLLSLHAGAAQSATSRAQYQHKGELKDRQWTQARASPDDGLTGERADTHSTPKGALADEHWSPQSLKPGSYPRPL